MGIGDILGALSAAIYGFLNITIGSIFDLPPVIAIFILAGILGIFITAVTRFTVNQEEMKKTRDEVSSFQKRMAKAQKEGNKKELKKLQPEQQRINQLNMKMMNSSMKPMLFTMIPILILFGWMRAHYTDPNMIAIHLPFDFSLFAYFHRSNPNPAGNWLGYLGWYILTSYFVSGVVRKIMNMA